MAVAVICNQIVEDLALPATFKTSLRLLALRDYNKGYGLSETIDAFDLDNYEKSISKGNAQNTMDAAIGIANEGLRDKRLLLVEMKFGVQYPKDMTISDLKKKIAHSRDILVGNRIDSMVVFLFDKGVQVAKSVIARCRIPNALVCTARDFSEKFRP